MESQLDRTRAAIRSLRRLLAPEPAPVDVELRMVESMTVAAAEGDVDLDDVLGWYAGAMAEIDATLGKPVGTPGGVYDNALFELGRGHVLVHRPSIDPPAQPARSPRCHAGDLQRVRGVAALLLHRRHHGFPRLTEVTGPREGPPLAKTASSANGSSTGSTAPSRRTDNVSNALWSGRGPGCESSAQPSGPPGQRGHGPTPADREHTTDLASAPGQVRVTH